MNASDPVRMPPPPSLEHITLVPSSMAHSSARPGGRGRITPDIPDQRPSEPAALRALSGPAARPATTEPPPAPKSTAQQSDLVKSATSLEPPLTQSRRERQRTGSGSRAAP